MPQDRKRRWFESIYIKIAFGALLGFIGISSGIYVGFGLRDQPASTPELLTPTEVGAGSTVGWTTADSYVRLQPGRPFPPEPCRLEDGTTTSFEDLLKGAPTVVLFTDLHCSRCYDLLAFWQAKLTPVLREEVRVIACFDRYGPDITEKYRRVLDGIQVVFYDQTVLRTEYGLDTWPSLIGVDADGVIQHFQLGFPGSVDRGIWKLYTNEGR